MAHGIGRQAVQLVRASERQPFYAVVDSNGDFLIMCNDLTIISNMVADEKKKRPDAELTVLRMVGLNVPERSDVRERAVEAVMELVLKRVMARTNGPADLTPEKVNAILEEVMDELDLKNVPKDLMRQTGAAVDALLKAAAAKGKAKPTGSKS